MNISAKWTLLVDRSESPIAYAMRVLVIPLDGCIWMLLWSLWLLFHSVTVTIGRASDWRSSLVRASPEDSSRHTRVLLTRVLINPFN